MPANVFANRWEESLDALVAFEGAHGRLPVTDGPEDGDTRLANWVQKQRRRLIDGTMDPVRAQRLAEATGITAQNPRHAFDERIEARIAALAAYVRDNERLPPRVAVDEELAALGEHLRSIRLLSEGGLSPAHTAAARAIAGLCRHAA